MSGNVVSISSVNYLIEVAEDQTVEVVEDQIAVVAVGIQGPAGVSGSGGGSSVPLPGTVTRVNNYISQVALTGGNTYVITRDGSNRISTINDGVYLWTFTRDGNNRIASWTVVHL